MGADSDPFGDGGAATHRFADNDLAGTDTVPFDRTPQPDAPPIGTDHGFSPTDRYIELVELGRGGTGRVVAARHVTSGRVLAIKRLSADLVGDASFRERFRNEAAVLAQVRHPNNVALYWYREGEGVAELGIELIPGPSLRAILRRGEMVPEAALLVLRGSLLGLDHAHRLHIIHRDYKPENVIVDLAGESHLVDFGIAVPFGERGELAGTPRYMAPEQWQGHPASPSTDVYSATATFFEMVTGSLPYTADTIGGLRTQHLEAPIPADAAPPAVRRLILQGLAKSSDARPASAGLFARELERVAVDAYGPDWASRGVAALALAATAAGAGAAAVGGGAAGGIATAPAATPAGAVAGPAGPGAAGPGGVGGAAGAGVHPFAPGPLAAGHPTRRHGRGKRSSGEPSRLQARVRTARQLKIGGAVVGTVVVLTAALGTVLKLTTSTSSPPAPATGAPFPVANVPPPVLVDPCLVGTWKWVAGDRDADKYDGALFVSERFGRGSLLTITAAGGSQYDYGPEAPSTGRTSDGLTVVVKRSGVDTESITAHQGTKVSFDVQEGLRFTFTDRAGTTPGVVLRPETASQERYSCAPSSLQLGSSTYARVAA